MSTEDLDDLIDAVRGHWATQSEMAKRFPVGFSPFSQHGGQALAYKVVLGLLGAPFGPDGEPLTPTPDAEEKP